MQLTATPRNGAAAQKRRAGLRPAFAFRPWTKRTLALTDAQSGPAARAPEKLHHRHKLPPMAGGAVLLEVILALVLFAAAAAIIGAGLHSAIAGVERQKLNAHAVNLAASVLAEIQMGLRPPESVGPESFDSPFDRWTWELVLTPIETDAGEPGDLTRVEVIVRHGEPALVQRLTQVLKLEKKTRPSITTAASLSP